MTDTTFLDYEREDGGFDHHFWCDSTYQDGLRCNCGYKEAVDEMKRVMAAHRATKTELPTVGELPY